MTIKTSHAKSAAASADEAAVPHAMPTQAGKGVLARRHLYMSAAVVALIVAGGAAGIQPAMADGINRTTPTVLDGYDVLGNPGLLTQNRPVPPVCPASALMGPNRLN